MLYHTWDDRAEAASKGVNKTVSLIANALGIQVPFGGTPTERRDYLIDFLLSHFRRV